MSDVLSQSEIDALLAAMFAGNINEENNTSPAGGEESSIVSTILEENFKFSKKHIDVFENVYKKYEKLLWSNMLKGINAEISLQSVQEIRYAELMHSIPYPSVLATFWLRPLDGYLLLETTPSLIYKIADMVYGDYKYKKQAPSNFSEKDIDISRKITSDFIKYLEIAWSSTLEVRSKLDYIEIDPAKLNLFFNNESIALASFSLSIGNESFVLNICVPYPSIEKYLNHFEINNRDPEVQSNSNVNLNNCCNSVNLNIKVILDTVQLSLDEIIKLQKGTILDIHKKHKNKVSILVEENHCFNGEIGSIGNKKAVKIVDLLEMEDKYE